MKVLCFEYNERGFSICRFRFSRHQELQSVRKCKCPDSETTELDLPLFNQNFGWNGYFNLIYCFTV